MLVLLTAAVCAFVWLRFVLWSIQDVRYGIVTRRNAVQWSALFLAASVALVGLAMGVEWAWRAVLTYLS